MPRPAKVSVSSTWSSPTVWHTSRGTSAPRSTLAPLGTASAVPLSTVISPTSSSVASSLRLGFPVGPFGMLSTKRTRSGILFGPSTRVAPIHFRSTRSDARSVWSLRSACKV